MKRAIETCDNPKSSDSLYEGLMTELKPIDQRLLRELMKDCRKSDRQLAETLGVSQPTVTRRRRRLEEEVIEGFTAIPRLDKIGFGIAAFTFLKVKFSNDRRKTEQGRRKGREWVSNQPNIIFATLGDLTEWDGMIVSIHKDYSDFETFGRTLEAENAEYVSERRSFITVTNPELIAKPFHLKYLTRIE